MKHSILLFFFFPLLVFGGNENTHYGARSAGMAHSSVTLYDVWSVHHNQAGLAWLEAPTAGVFFQNRFTLKELSQSGVAFAYPIKGGTFGLSYAGFGYQLYRENKIGLAYSMKFSDRISGGVQLNYHSLRLGNTYGQGNTFSVEAGIQAKITEKFTAGVHLFNPTRAKLVTFNDERIPTIFRFGVNYAVSEKVLLTGEAEKDIDFDAVFRAGLEYKTGNQFFLRTGIATNPGLISFGFGYWNKGLKVDLATSYHQVLGFSPEIGLSYRFNKKSE